MAAEGVSTAEIARRLDVVPSTVWKWLHPDRTREFNRRDAARPERRASHAAWVLMAREDPERVKMCSSCGGRTGSFVWASEQADVCATCRGSRREARWRLIAMWWGEGLTYREIGERLGWTTASAGMEVHRMREAGWNLPRRPKGIRNTA